MQIKENRLHQMLCLRKKIMKRIYICFYNAAHFPSSIFYPSEDSGVGRLVEWNPFL